MERGKHHHTLNQDMSLEGSTQYHQYHRPHHRHHHRHNHGHHHRPHCHHHGHHDNHHQVKSRYHLKACLKTRSDETNFVPSVQCHLPVIIIFVIAIVITPGELFVQCRASIINVIIIE